MASKTVLLNIVSTMSDRAATQQKFNDFLQDYRKCILIENLGDTWLDMSADEQLAISKLNNFFCALHALVHMAESANSCIKLVEEATFEGNPPIFDPSFKTASESGSVRLLRTCSKAFACGGDEKSGIYGSFFIFCEGIFERKQIE